MEYDDILQICCLGLVKAAKGYDPGRGAFSPYAVRIMDNEVLMEVRRERTRLHGSSLDAPLGGDDDDLTGAGVIDDEAASFVGGLEDRDQVARLLSLLDPRDRRMLWLWVVEDVSQHDIAAALGISQSYASRKLRQARARLAREAV